jgi:HNH endonuclease
MSVSKRLRYEVLRRDNHACRYCGAKAPDAILTVDHVVPTALGGSDDPGNLVAACKDCNSGKSSSSADASLVGDVADDAIRWARAQQEVARQMLEDLERAQRNRAEFKAAWNRWEGRDGQPVPLPDGWEYSVDQFVSAGLPMPILLDCVGKAMHNRRIRYGELFRYMCGIAWKRVGEIRQATTAWASEEPGPRKHVVNTPYHDAFELLLGRLHALDDLVDPSKVASLAEEFDLRHADDEDGDGVAIDYSGWGADLKAAVTLLEDQLDAESNSDDAWGQTSYGLIVDTLGQNFGYWVEAARARWMERGVQQPQWQDVDRAALRLAIEDFVRRTGPKGGAS